MTRKTFIVAAKSAFYLDVGKAPYRGLILVSPDGEAYQGAIPVISEPEKGERFAVDLDLKGVPDFGPHGIIQVQQVRNAPKGAVKDMFGLPDPNDFFKGDDGNDQPVQAS